MPKAQPQNLETIAALQSFCIFGYQTDDPLAALTAPDYFAGCAARLMANDLILVCADAATNPAWGLFLVGRAGAAEIALENVAGLTPDTVNGLTFLRSPQPLPLRGQKAGGRKATRPRGKAA